MVMVGFGGLLSILSVSRCCVAARVIERGAGQSAWSGVAVISFIVTLLSAVIIFYMLTKPHMM